MTRVLVAGIGNVFFGDDGFGVEVARRLADDPPDNTRVTDYGIRALHLAYELLDPPDLLIVADCMARGGAPGTLYVLEPDTADSASIADGHGMNINVVCGAVRQLGGAMPPMLVVGCEPASIDPGIGLSAHVTGAIPGAIELIRELVTKEAS